MHSGFAHITLTLGLGILVPCALWGQVIVEQKVIGSSGERLSNSSLEVNFTVGEAAILNLPGPSLQIDQGFHHGDTVEPPAPLEISTITTESQCPGYNDGMIKVLPTGCTDPYQITLVGVFNGVNMTVDDISFDGYTFQNLDSGSYEITVIGVDLCAYRDTFRVDLKNDNCGVEYYSGITPNGDGRNDEWIIDNIEINQPNTVTIFSRWGQKVWQASNYNNSSIVFNGYGQNGNILPDGTYFYTIEISGNQSASSSGWIQITR